MSQPKAEFEQTDKEGSTVLYAGTVTTTATAFPSTPDKAIDEISIRCAVDQMITSRLLFSFDNVTFHRLKVGESREEEPRGAITQVFLKALAGTVNYELAINYGRLPPHI